MCVTNFVKRNPKPVSVAVNPSALSKTPSLISQRLHGSLLPLLANVPVAKPATNVAVYNNSDSSTCSHYFPTHGGHNDNSEGPKHKPKRKRKPQKPGLTAKNHERHFVKHNYHDHAFDNDETDVDDETTVGERPLKPCTSTAQTFPMKLHAVMERVEADGLSHIVSWQPHGRCFCIHNPKEFTEIVLATYLRQGKLTSFQRQLNLYGFQRLTKGRDTGAYYHELFLRGKTNLAKRMKRTKIKGTKFKAASSPEQEPDFYSMPPVTALPQVSDESSADNDSHNYGSSYSREIPVRDNIPLEFSALSNFEPISLEAPRCEILQAPIQPFPMLSTVHATATASGTTMSSNPTSNGPVTMTNSMSALMRGFNFGSSVASTLPTVSAADRVLDDAVDAIFNGSDAADEDDSNLDDLWDSAGFGERDEMGRIENDLQLGNLLEAFLEES